MRINQVKKIFEDLGKNQDFVEAYNDFNGTNLTSLNTEQVFSVGTFTHLVKIKTTDNREVLITDAYFDIQYEGKNYIASGDFVDISSIRESKELNNLGLTVRLSNVRTEYVSMISAGLLDHSEVKIDLAFLNPNNGNVQTSFNIFTGEIEKLNVEIDYTDNESKNETEVTINSIWAVLDKRARNHCSDGIHRSYPGNENDTFFSRIGKWNSQAKWTSVK